MCDGTSDNDQQRFITCRVCGQVIDTHDQNQVFHHGPEPHQPLPDSS